MALEGFDEKTRDELAQLALQMAGGEKTRKRFLELTKEVHPGTPIPEIDQERAIESRLAEARKADHERIQKLEDNELRRTLADRRGAAMQAHQLSEDDMKKVEEMIGKKELPADYTWAAQLYKQQVDQAAPTTYGSGGFGHAELPTNEDLLVNPDKWATSTAHEMIDQMRNKGHTFSNS